LNPVLGQLVQSQLLSTVDDMGQVLARSAVSREIVEEKDFAVAIVLDQGEVVALDNLLHLGSVIESAARIQDLFQFAMKPGDVILSNDPYSGGSQIQDFTVLAPFYYGREQICCLVCRAHLPDLGGQVPGGYFPFADDVWGEGSRIPPLKVVQESKIVGDKLDAVVINSRYPELFLVNLQAMLAALETGQRRMESMVKKYGKSQVERGMRYCITSTEAQVSTEMKGWPCGTYEGLSYIDHDVKRSNSLEVRVSLRLSPSMLTLDFRRSSPQSTGFVNSTRSNTLGCALVPLYAAMSGSVPVNSGLLKCVEVVTKEGSIVHPVFPAAVGWGPYHPGAEIVSAVSLAFSSMLPGSITTLSAKSMMIVARWPQQHLSFPLHLFLPGGASASQGYDGWGAPGPFSRSTTPSIEMVESHLPVRLRTLEIAADSAGHGRWRGEFGTAAEFEFTSPAVVDVIVEGQEHPSEAHANGEPGTGNRVEVDGEAVQRVAWNQALVSGRLSARSGGGAGWGDASERDVQSIQQDIDNELLSPSRAATVYGTHPPASLRSTVKV
jgi:N-methylhydantoinase B